MTKITLTGATNFNGAGSGSSALMPVQGYSYGDIQEVTEGTSGTGNVKIVLKLQVMEPGLEGFKLRKDVPITGDMNTKNGPIPNVRSLYRIYFSMFTAAGASIEEANEMVQKLEGKELDTDDIIKEMTGQRVYFVVKAEEPSVRFDRWSTTIERFVSKQEFEKNAASGGHHWNNPDQQTATVATSVPKNGTAGTQKVSGRV